MKVLFLYQVGLVRLALKSAYGLAYTWMDVRDVDFYTARVLNDVDVAVRSVRSSKIAETSKAAGRWSR